MNYPTPKRRARVVRRMREPSTWGGLAGAAASVAPFLPPQYQAVAALVGALAGAVAAFRADPGNPEEQ